MFVIVWRDALTSVYWNEFPQHSSWCEQAFNFLLKQFMLMSVKIADKNLKYCLFVSLIQMFFFNLCAVKLLKYVIFIPGVSESNWGL